MGFSNKYGIMLKYVCVFYLNIANEQIIMFLFLNVELYYIIAK